MIGSVAAGKSWGDALKNATYQCTRVRVFNAAHKIYLGKTHIKKCFFFIVVGLLRFYPDFTNGLVVQATSQFLG